ncbi:MAG: polysaccharide deacetylase family protein [Christensenellaceae bacterium]|nr:polysaccharide deacetylase family protein [Christensenellaceae bacterium]
MKKATLFRIAAAALTAAAIFVYASIALKEDTEVFAQNSALVSGNGLKKEAALTIDTSFGESDYTEAILDVLDEHGAKATFAVMGIWARENPDLVKEMIDRGHDIISHSMTHERYKDLGKEEAAADAQASLELLRTDFGIGTDMIRLPYGSGTEEINAALSENGLKVVGWSLDSEDWKGEPAEEIAEDILDDLKPGDIVLFQNNVEATPAAIGMVLEEMGKRAYSAVTLQELAAEKIGGETK